MTDSVITNDKPFAGPEQLVAFAENYLRRTGMRHLVEDYPGIVEAATLKALFEVGPQVQERLIARVEATEGVHFTSSQQEVLDLATGAVECVLWEHVNLVLRRYADDLEAHMQKQMDESEGHA